MLLRALPLAALTLVAGLCGGDERVRFLEAEKQKLLATTVEKKEFWAQVERKGAVAKRLRELEGRRAELEAEVAGQDARRAAFEPPLAQAREVNGRAGAIEAEIGQRELELGERLRALEETLERFDAGAAPEAGG